jgi:hypothetical protein
MPSKLALDKIQKFSAGFADQFVPRLSEWTSTSRRLLRYVAIFIALNLGTSWFNPGEAFVGCQNTLEFYPRYV